MHIDVENRGPVTVIRVSGSLDVTTSNSLSSAVEEQTRAGHVRLVADLSAVESTSSSGIGALVAALKESRRLGGDFRLAAARGNVQRVVDLCGLTSILKHYVETDEAVASFVA